MVVVYIVLIFCSPHYLELSLLVERVFYAACDACAFALNLLSLGYSSLILILFVHRNMYVLYTQLHTHFLECTGSAI